MNDKHKKIVIGFIVLIFSLLIYFIAGSKSHLPELSHSKRTQIHTLPDFTLFEDTQKKKAAFFDFLYPIVVEENTFLLAIREQLKSLQNKNNYTDQEIAWLQTLKADYLIEEEDTTKAIALLLAKVDSIPPSLVLAQAAIESGWGTSRFARKANNLFGHWCFSEGCGLVPKSRDADKAHEVAKFDSVNDSVSAYFKNLNAFYRYDEFRKIRSRSNIKETGQGVLALTKGLSAYSELGDVYIKKVQNLITFNKLEKFDLKFAEQLNEKQ